MGKALWSVTNECEAENVNCAVLNVARQKEASQNEGPVKASGKESKSLSLGKKSVTIA